MTVPGQVNLSQATQTTPAPAPVNDPPLPAIQRAGVNLTWGVLGIISFFLLVMLVYLWMSDPGSGLSRTTHVAGAAFDSVAYKMYAADQAAFHDFWLKILQMVLLNVLLPVLTALLGYVFATQQRPTQP